MLGDIAVRYYKADEGCYSCILLACEEFYGVKLPECIYDMLPGFAGGFGINAMCSAVVTGIMFISYYYRDDEAAMKRARIFFIDRVNAKLCTTCCGRLKKCCKRAIYECGEALEAAIIGSG